jgi:hypothetical protein
LRKFLLSGGLCQRKTENLGTRSASERAECEARYASACAAAAAAAGAPAPFRGPAADSALGEHFLDVVSANGFALDARPARFLCGLTFRLGARRAGGSIDRAGFLGGTADMIDGALRLQAPWLEAARRAPRERSAMLSVRELFLPSADHTTNLMRAAEAGDEVRVRELLAAGAPLLCADGSGRWTALHWASHRGDARIVAALLEADAEGATVDARDDGGATPLILASALGHEGAVRALLARGARQELQNRVGRSAMHKAAEFAAAGVIAQLCVAPGAAAALALREQYGYTPHKVAVDKGHALCAELLRVHGAL